MTDKFGKAISSVIRRYDLRHNLEIGSWDGSGSTQCFIDGMSKLTGRKHLYCLEAIPDRFEFLRKTVKSVEFITPVCSSSIFWSDFLPKDFESDVWNSPYNKISPVYHKNVVKSWYDSDCALIKQTVGFISHAWEFHFDAVLIDGGEFSGYSEYVLLKDRVGCFMLDDTHRAYKCNRIYKELSEDKNWLHLYDFPTVRNGAAIFIRRFYA